MAQAVKIARANLTVATGQVILKSTRRHSWESRRRCGLAGDLEPQAPLGRIAQLGRDQQHLFLARSVPRDCGRDPDAVPAVRGCERAERLPGFRARSL